MLHRAVDWSEEFETHLYKFATLGCFTLPSNAMSATDAPGRHQVKPTLGDHVNWATISGGDNTDEETMYILLLPSDCLPWFLRSNLMHKGCEEWSSDDLMEMRPLSLVEELIIFFWMDMKIWARIFARSVDGLGKREPSNPDLSEWRDSDVAAMRI